MRILLQGYYGRGNWGDDLLMLISFNILRKNYPNAAIEILTADRPRPYIHTILGEKVPLLMQGHHGHYDMIVHGGGGVFFDFNLQPLHRKLVESIVLLLGHRMFIRAETWLRRRLGTPRTSAPLRIALGVGVGTFTAGSPVLPNALSAFSGMSAMWVRDVHSQRNLARFSDVLNAAVILGSDMVFMRGYWLLPRLDPKPTPAAKPRIGVVLRDEHGLDASALEAVANTLQELMPHYDLTLFFFEAEADARLIAALQSFSPVVWEPDSMQLSHFAELLSAQDVIVTSRAHGAICAACLGIPSIIIEIEPKLRRVHEMLPRSSSLLPLASLHSELQPLIERALQTDAALIAEDVAHNQALSETALAALKPLLQSAT